MTAASRNAALITLSVLAFSCVQAAEIKVLSAVGMRQVMLDLGPKFERSTGNILKTSFDSTGLLAKRVAAGEHVDVVMLNQSAIDTLVKDGKVRSDSVSHIARSVAAVAIRKGAPKPDISSIEGFKQL